MLLQMKSKFKKHVEIALIVFFLFDVGRDGSNFPILLLKILPFLMQRKVRNRELSDPSLFTYTVIHVNEVKVTQKHFNI